MGALLFQISETDYKISMFKIMKTLFKRMEIINKSMKIDRFLNGIFRNEKYSAKNENLQRYSRLNSWREYKVNGK